MASLVVAEVQDFDSILTDFVLPFLLLFFLDTDLRGGIVGGSALPTSPSERLRSTSAGFCGEIRTELHSIDLVEEERFASNCLDTFPGVNPCIGIVFGSFVDQTPILPSVDAHHIYVSSILTRHEIISLCASLYSFSGIIC